MEAPVSTPEDTAEDPTVRERTADRAEALAEFLREETTGGKILLVAAAAALIWANVASGSYDDFWHSHLAIGPDWLELDLSLAHWASDGLLAIFFFVAGMELKRELLTGELSDRRAATLPVFAAVGGMIVPALIALAASGGAAADGGAWAIPTATDIAFALGVLAVAGPGRSRRPPTSRSRSGCSRWQERRCPPVRGRCCSRSPSSTTCSRSR